MYDFPMMARFNRWTNAKLFGTVANLDESEYFRDQGAFFGSVHRTLNHLLVVDRLWTGRIEGIDRGIRSLDQVLYENLDTLRSARVQEDDRIVALVDAIPHERLDSVVTYDRIIGTGREEMRSAISS